MGPPGPRELSALAHAVVAQRGAVRPAVHAEHGAARSRGTRSGWDYLNETFVNAACGDKTAMQGDSGAPHAAILLQNHAVLITQC